MSRGTFGVVEVHDLLRLETAVWQALVDGDLAADAALLAEDFVGLTPTGFSDRADHLAGISAGPTVAAFDLSEARVVTVSDGAHLLLYRAVYERVDTPGSSDSMFVASLWCRRAGRWVNVFSQDTPDTGIPVV